MSRNPRSSLLQCQYHCSYVFHNNLLRDQLLYRSGGTNELFQDTFSSFEMDKPDKALAQLGRAFIRIVLVG